MSPEIAAGLTMVFAVYAAVRTTESGDKREWCWPFCHAWGKWASCDFTQQATVSGIAVGDEVTVTRQVRACKRCGLQQKRGL